MIILSLSRLALRLDWSELDFFGHINNVAYFKYVQASRIAYWQLLGMGKMDIVNGIGPMVAEVKCRFKKPLHFPGNIIITASMSWMKQSSFGIHHRILAEDGSTAAEADDVIVLWNYRTHQKISIPDAMRAAAEGLEGRSMPQP